MTLSRYIHLKPVRAKKVQKPEESKWTSYRFYINGKAGNSIVTREDTLRCFSERKKEAVKAYRAFVESGICGIKNPFEDLESGLVLGCDEFIEKIVNMLGKTRADDDLPQIRRLRREIPAEKVIDVCCRYDGKTEEEH